MPESSLSPQSETKNLTTGSHTFVPGDFVEVIVLMDFSYRDKADTGISEIRKMPFLKQTFLNFLSTVFVS